MDIGWRWLDVACKLSVMELGIGASIMAPKHSHSEMSELECMMALPGDLSGTGGLSYQITSADRYLGVLVHFASRRWRKRLWKNRPKPPQLLGLEWAKQEFLKLKTATIITVFDYSNTLR